MDMKRFLIGLYKSLFVRKAFYRFHHRLLNISLWGLGVLNSDNDRLSGEDYFIHHLTELVDPKDKFIILDVGANVGDYSSKVKTVYPDACLYAFEPDPASFKLLSANAQRRGYQAFNVALGAVSGRAPFYNQPGGGSAHASLYRDVITEIHDPDPTQVEVSVLTVAQFAQDHQLHHIHLLKIDTEGNELNVLLGARALIEQRSIDLIQFEFDTMNVVSRVFLRDISSLLKEYRLYRMLPDGMVLLKPYPTFLSEIFAYQNIVAVRNDL